MIKFYAPEYRDKVHRLLILLVPIIVTQLASFGMCFFDASMSGQAGPAELAGTAMAGNLWMPVHTSLGSILYGCMPIVAHLIGSGEKEKIRPVLQQEMLLALVFSVLVGLLFVLGAPFFYDFLGLEAQVRHVAIWYGIGVAGGVLPFFLGFPLRCLLDTLGYTNVTMKIFLVLLPINGILNYILIFGAGPVPALGGIGAGVATGITFWIGLFLFVWAVQYVPEVRKYRVFSHFCIDKLVLGECWRIGYPMGIGTFLECGVFALTAFMIAKFGTVFIAADMAATNFSTILYMLPCSFSLAATIVVGIAEGAGNRKDSHCYAVLCMQMNFLLCVVYTVLEVLFMEQVIGLYTKDATVAAVMGKFMVWAVLWQYFDAVNAPLQGVLRGHKDVKFISYAGILVFWCICMPYGLFCDYGLHRYPTCYWEGINLSLFTSACLLFWRWRRIEQHSLPVSAK